MSNDSPEVEVDFDKARSLMYEELRDEHGPIVDETLEMAVVGQLVQMWDNRDDLEEMFEERQ